MSLSLRALATKTSWAHPSSRRLTHGEWVPASIAMRKGCSDAKRRLKASGVVRSLPSSITSPLCESMRHRGRSTCRLCPIRLSCLVGLCYHHSWADLLLSFGPLAKESPYSLCRPQGYCVGGRPSHLIFRELRHGKVRRILLLRDWVNRG